MKNIATDKQLDMFKGTEEIMNDSTIDASSRVSTELRQMDAAVRSTEILNASTGVTSDYRTEASAKSTELLNASKGVTSEYFSEAAMKSPEILKASTGVTSDYRTEAAVLSPNMLNAGSNNSEILNTEAAGAVTSDLKKFEDATGNMQNLKDIARYI